MEDQEKSGERASDSTSDEDRGSKRNSFSAWLNKQSLPRILGLLLGNTRDLELRLIDKQKEVDYLKSQVDKWQNQCIAFQDSSLLSKGMKPTTPVENQTPQPNTQIKSTLPGESLAIASEIDRLTEVWKYRPNDLEDEINDLLAVNTPRNKMIVERFTAYLQSIPSDEQGVVILQ